MIHKVKNIIMWAMTYRCNMSCDYCFLKERIKCWDELTDNECVEFAEKIANDASWKPDAIWLTGGEPTVKKCLPKIIKIFESNGIKCVVTTNGMCSDKFLSEILDSNPRGINVSLESVDDRINSKNRGCTSDVVSTIKKIAEKKSEYTILGVSCVISPNNINSVLDFAKEVKLLGVEYLSLNPLIGGDCKYTVDDFVNIKRFCDLMTSSKSLKLPNEFYFELLEDFFLGKRKIDIPCPAGKNFMFIAPWGSAYPCSNENWQISQDKNIIIGKQPCLKQVFAELDNLFCTNALTTQSKCFGERCIGCWKLYYDSIFTL